MVFWLISYRSLHSVFNSVIWQSLKQFNSVYKANPVLSSPKSRSGVNILWPFLFFFCFVFNKPSSFHSSTNMVSSTSNTCYDCLLLGWCIVIAFASHFLLSYTPFFSFLSYLPYLFHFIFIALLFSFLPIIHSFLRSLSFSPIFSFLSISFLLPFFHFRYLSFNLSYQQLFISLQNYSFYSCFHLLLLFVVFFFSFIFIFLLFLSFTFIYFFLLINPKRTQATVHTGCHRGSSTCTCRVSDF